jgi:arylsulfatase A-like enzyme
MRRNRTNILLITTDEQRVDTVGRYGSPISGAGFLANSPNLDALAARGTLFEHSYCASPVCVPSRASWMTGLHVPTHKSWTNGEQMQPGVVDQVSTFPARLKAVGYHLSIVGKRKWISIPGTCSHWSPGSSMHRGCEN